MKLWMSGELQSDVADGYRRARKTVEGALVDLFAHGDYGPGIVKLAFIPIILGALGPPDFEEVKRYKKREKSFEFRLRIDHDRFLTATANEQIRLIFEGLLRCLALMEDMNIPDVDVGKIRADVDKTAAAHGWL